MKEPYDFKIRYAPLLLLALTDRRSALGNDIEITANNAYPEQIHHALKKTVG